MPPLAAVMHGVEALNRALAGRYALEDEIGSGGMAVVYRARDLVHGRAVAIKVLRTDIAARIGPDRFLREIRILSRLTSPHILPLYESGQAADRLFFVMPYVQGGSLREMLRRQPFLPLDEALRFTTEVGEALDFAHSQGIVHRDVKPENVLIEGGHAMVADFGIARAIDAVAAELITTESLVIGTPAYMSPEQGSGSPHLDGSSDLYSLACLTYEMLAGGVPFPGPSAAAIQARKTLESVPPIHTIRPAVSAAIDAVLRRGLAVVPADRYATAREFAQALERPVPAPPRRGARAAALVAAGLVSALFVVGDRAAAPPPARGSRLVVAEFANRTGDSRLDGVGFMAADWITEGLQRTSAGEVVPALTALEASRYLRPRAESTAGTAFDAFREETGADLVIAGSYYRNGDSLSFQSQITDARAGRVLAAIGPIAAPLDDPVRAINELRTRTMGFLASMTDERLTSAAGLDPTPPTYAAYREFSTGMAAYVGSDFDRATTHLSRAYALDTTYPIPLLFASISLSNQGRYREADSVAQILAGRRNRLNPFYQDWLEYRLALLAGNRPLALTAVRRLAAHAPGTKATYNLAVEAFENGRLDEAIGALRSLEPDRGAMRGWLPYWELLGAAHHLRGEFRAELGAGAESRTRYPGRLSALIPAVRALTALGRDSELERLIGQAARMGPDPYGTTLGGLLRQAGEEAVAHGRPVMSRAYFVRSQRWYADRMQQSAATRADTMAAAELAYNLGELEHAAGLLGREPAAPEEIGLAGRIAVRRGRSDEARVLAARLEADRRPHQFGGPSLAAARIGGVLRDTVVTLRALANAFRAGREYDLWIHRTPEFAWLRLNPEFQLLVRPNSRTSP
jgi:tetratricopeptide (TPR) repeat protein